MTTETTTPHALIDSAEVAEVAEGAEAVLVEVAAMLRSILDEYGLDDIEIEWDSRFHDDLELESVDLVALAGKLAERYGERVNLAEFIADLGLDEIIELTVGQLVAYVTAALVVVDGSDGSDSSDASGDAG
ncbi:phosphopantetheine-binding protein [Catenulispora rubra]|uniref:phosphopantetheine-binding protein n=1 Tax=Catenulispora rubra TaxID=280293 RepID=UPI002B277011|nr:phosphopantetheine-binding protein [Catenulispora rubra]